jgi:hypothetical protein
MPITRLKAAANMMAPIMSNKSSVKDIVHRAMRPEPAVTAGAWSDPHFEVVTFARVIIARECYVAKAQEEQFTSSTGADQRAGSGRFAALGL